MKQDRKYILFVLVLFALFLALMFLRTESISWVPTFSVNEKSPFASRALYERLPDLFEQNSPRVLYIPATEFKQEQDTSTVPFNYLLIGQSLKMDKFDTRALISLVSNGNSVFIAAESLSSSLEDTLGFYPVMNAWKGTSPFDEVDTLKLGFEKPYFTSQKQFSMRPEDNKYAISVSDSASEVEILSRNSEGNPVYVRRKMGKGYVYLHSVPLAFTNFYLLPARNDEYISRCFSFLPVAPVFWDEYYKVGRNESTSPIRVILANKSLRLAWVMLLIFTLLYMLFQSKRRQRIIPVIKPFENSTLQFVETLGRLYLSQKDHKALALKKILYFSEKVRHRFLLIPEFSKLESAKQVSHKTGIPLDEVSELFKWIHHIQNSSDISPETLVKLNKMMESFWNKTFSHSNKS